VALFFPDIHSKNLNLTSGERRFATCLLRKLEDDYLCWLQAVIGSRQLRPDFIIMHPGRGILTLEVKDWKLSTIRSMDRLSTEILTGRGLKNVPNPLEQARQYATAIVSILEHDPLLVQQEGKYKGHLLLPWGHGAVLTNITRRQFETAQLSEAMAGDLVICQDEMTEDQDAEAFQQRLWNMFQYSFGGLLSLARIDRVRWHLFPELRIHQHSLAFPEAEAPDKEGKISQFLPELIKVMDTQQEKIARNLGEGHRIIHGVAGSGKTLLLAFRCLQLHERHPGQPILVLCYNKALAAWLSDMLHTRGAGDAVQVRHFHGWCKDMCVLYHLDLPAGDKDLFAKQVEAVIAGVEQERVPRGQYAAILIDEGHDFEPEWFRLLVQMVDPETNSLLLLYDDAQSIYGERRRRSVSWASLGIKAAGRSTILKINYRNTIEALDFSYHFLSAYLDGAGADSEIPLVRPEAGGRNGIHPLVLRFANDSEELAHLSKWLQSHAAAGVLYEHMAVLYRFNNQFDALQRFLSCHGIPVSQTPSKPGVCLMTMHASKGLEFRCVAIYDLGCMPYNKVPVEEEAKVLYVAMTRATEQLLISYHRESAFTRRCEALAK